MPETSCDFRSRSPVIADLDRFGPQMRPATRIKLEVASDYCRDLARHHYENFSVASWLLPRELRRHFYHVYAYCRWADDLADEAPNPGAALELLHWWEWSLAECYRGRAIHPVFVALMETIEAYQIPQQPFQDLLHAFRQDQRQTRYVTVAEMLDYCRCSANPVGQIVLYLGRCWSAENARDSDAICTGLQLANFCQDVGRDFDRGRIYLPVESWRSAEYTAAMFERREFNAAFQQLMAAEVGRAWDLLQSGRQLARRVPRELQLDIDLFVRGGLEILTAIRRQKFNVWSRRPLIGKVAKLRLLVTALGSRILRRQLQ